MDNVTHTLVGLALAEAGLKRASPRATLTLAIGANLPDLDVVAYLVGSNADALAFRRGWTHGVLAMLVLPILLTGIVLAASRPARERPYALLGLAALGVCSHPLLDLLNVYGVRLLMPFSNRWFYGDALFIVDPWVWLVLIGALLLVRRPEVGVRAPRAALALVAGYAVLMASGGRIGAGIVERRTGARLRTMVAPVFGNPFRREVIRDGGGGGGGGGDHYETGSLRLGVRTRYLLGADLPVGRQLPGVAAASATFDGQRFLAWARFPRFESSETGSGSDSIRVAISDLRFSRGARSGGGGGGRGAGAGREPWASISVVVPR